jgi:hypothetical protein
MPCPEIFRDPLYSLLVGFVTAIATFVSSPGPGWLVQDGTSWRKVGTVWECQTTAEPHEFGYTHKLVSVTTVFLILAAMLMISHQIEMARR